MKKRKFSNIIIMMICTVFMLSSFSITASADMGPKASVRVLFENLGNEECYGTLLSKNAAAGPYTVWDGDEENIDNYNLDLEIWRAFVEYKDTDGYYFLQTGWKVSDTKEIEWSYYPPSHFKILLYYPETETFVVSGIYERYAFDTYYTVDMNGVNIGSVEYNEELSTNERITAYRSYNYIKEILSFVARIDITIVLEVAVALLFGFRKKKQLLVLASVNVVTQIILNVLLNVINYNSGLLAFVCCYVFFEIIVFGLEAMLYCTLLKKVSEKPKKNWYYVLYALVANAVSFGTGFIAAQMSPNIF